MKSIRSFSCAAVLTVSALGQLVGLAHAQSPMQGKFTLPYEVSWENTVVPAGDYKFSLTPAGGSELLTLQKIGGNSFGFLVLVHPSERANSADLSKLVLVAKGNQTFVSSMQLAKLGVTLDFIVPDEPAHASKQIARAEIASASSSAK